MRDSVSNYDQSCSVDTDCELVSSGDYCGGECQCGRSTINVNAVAQFNADVASAQSGSDAPDTFCGCPLETEPCCRGGICQVQCSFPGDTLAACVDAGGTCMPFFMCAQPGPSNACAYSDEACCITANGAR